MHIFFSGIGGVGIGPLASIAKDAGHTVSGSDKQPSTMTQQLEKEGVSISYTQSYENISLIHSHGPIDWYVYTAALPDDHPELQFVHDHNIKSSKRDALLAHIISEKNLTLLAVAGTHGKTTTSAMLVWLFQQLDIPISYSVGASLSFGPSGIYTPKSNYFIYECDEFDRNFLHFSPEYAAITSYDYDHPDTYPTKDTYRDAFAQFITQSHSTVMFHTSAIEIFKDSPFPAGVEIVDDNNEYLSSIKLAGKHNRQNALLATMLFENIPDQKYSRRQLVEILDRFPGSSRRFEKLAPNLYSDYAHHPTEIEATLQLARELSDSVIVVYQPHQNTRQHDIRSLYADCFKEATKVYWLPTYLSREDDTIPILSPEELSNDVKVPVILSELNDELWQRIIEEKKNGALVVCMGAGDIDQWIRTNI